MGKQAFALELGGPKDVELEWGATFGSLVARYQGQEVGRAASKRELVEGVQYALPDGSRLRIKLVKESFNTGLDVSRDGVHLPGSRSDPDTLIKQAVYTVYFVAGLSSLVGAVVVATGDLESGIASLIMGAIFGVLGFLTMRRSIVALGLATGLYLVDGLITIAGTLGAGKPNLFGLVIKFLILSRMVTGLSGMWRLRQKEKAEQPAYSKLDHTPKVGRARR